MLLFWRDHSGRCVLSIPVLCSLVTTCQNGVVRNERLELVRLYCSIYCVIEQRINHKSGAGWPLWIRNPPTCFSRASAVGSRGKVKVHQGVLACVALLHLRCQTEPHSQTPHFEITLLVDQLYASQTQPKRYCSNLRFRTNISAHYSYFRLLVFFP